MALTVAFWRRAIVRYAVGLCRELATRDAIAGISLAGVVLAVLLVQVLLAPWLLPASSAAALTLALLLEHRDKRSSLAGRV